MRHHGLGHHADEARPHHLDEDRVEGVHVGGEAELELDVGVAVLGAQLREVRVQRRLRRDVAHHHAPLVDVEVDAVCRDAIEALALFLHQVEELVAQHARGLGGGEDLVGALLLRRLGLAVDRALALHRRRRLLGRLLRRLLVRARLARRFATRLVLDLPLMAKA